MLNELANNIHDLQDGKQEHDACFFIFQYFFQLKISCVFSKFLNDGIKTGVREAQFK